MQFGITDEKTCEWPSSCCRPSPFSVVRPAVAPSRKPRALVGRGPGEIADALHAEHRVEDVERHRHFVGMAVRGRRRDPRGKGASLVDALLEDLALLVLAVEHHLVLVDRLVLLALGGKDAELAEHPLHAEGA